jgi:predicted O-linked N-acetylglucosamine transferase (SPINDLY family)
MASSFLTALGMTDMIEADLDAYVARAIALAQDAPARARLRARLAEARETSDLFKVETLARRLEAAYRAMWSAWVGGRAKSSRIGQSGRSSP